MNNLCLIKSRTHISQRKQAHKKKIQSIDNKEIETKFAEAHHSNNMSTSTLSTTTMSAPAYNLPRISEEEEGDVDSTSTTHHVPLIMNEKHEEVCPRNKVSEIATKAFRRASAESNVLSRAKLQDIALLRMEELYIGTFLGKGSFSDAYEIGKIDLLEKDADPARNLLATSYRRKESGTCRYAIKFLNEEIRSDPEHYAVGTSDLVIEGMFLASLSHPNIIKVRGLPAEGLSKVGAAQSKGYFLVMDRLFGTLGDKIYGDWRETHVLKKDKLAGIYSSRKNALARKTHLTERLRVAFDISAALKFLHSKRIIYRDLKPENLGFDVRGDIKLFDLGLVKELHPRNQDSEGTYKLSLAGTPRYMAPEVGNRQRYNLSADVYSISMLLYEIITLEKPFKGFTYARLKQDIFQDGQRPPLKSRNGIKVWPKSMRTLISAGWNQNPKIRPSMDDVYEQLKVAYVTIGNVSSLEDISHTRRRSTFVAKKLSQISLRHLMQGVDDNNN